MNSERAVLCPENEALALYMWQKRQQLLYSPKGLSENTDKTLYKAYTNICISNNPIQTLKDLSLIKGVGKWILKLMQGFFESGPGSSVSEDLSQKDPSGKKVKGTKRYVPQKNSVAYALLISLYRGTSNGTEFMRKQELIDAAEASGLSRVPIAPEKGKGKPGFGNSQRDWYSGWSCMKTLVTKGLVVKSSNPAKYMLTQEGREAARECLIRSGLDPLEGQADLQKVIDVDAQKDSEMECDVPDAGKQTTAASMRSETLTDIPTESLERFTSMGFSRDEVIRAFTEVSKNSQNKDLSLLWPAVLCVLRESQIYGVDSHILRRGDHLPRANRTHKDAGDLLEDCADRLASGRSEPTLRNTNGNLAQLPVMHDADPASSSCSLRACSSRDKPVHKSSKACPGVSMNIWTTPPLTFGQKFEDVYEIILVLDDREHFATQGSRSRRIVENICTQFKIKIEVRRLPVGDGIWIARHKYNGSEYVLDFIVERKNVEDLRSSIRDNRYKDQKLRLLRCGLKKLIYIVEGDPNSLEAAESIKTACFTTEILEDFDVQRTNGLGDTLRKYGHLTRAINQYYRLQSSEDQSRCSGVPPLYDEFLKRCQDLDKMTVSDVFSIQLMQVPQVTEEVAIAVLDMYPTLLSLASAYSCLEGDISAQVDMLRKQSNNVVNAAASKNIFQLVWGN